MPSKSNAQVLRRQGVLPPAPSEDSSFRVELGLLLKKLPVAVAEALHSTAARLGRDLYDLTEIYVQVGRRAEAAFQDNVGAHHPLI